jgi:hypothetical protein
MQVDVYELMMKKDWGPTWKELIDAVVEFEESQAWYDASLPRSEIRPEEIGAWMKEHRKPGDNNKILPNFGERLLAWWRNIGPEFRREPRPEDLAEGEQWPPQSMTGWEWQDWMGLRSSGNNGIILAVQALTWWGQFIVNTGAGDGLGAGEAALATNEGWQYLLGDMLYALRCMTDEMTEEARAAVATEKAFAIAYTKWEEDGGIGKRPTRTDQTSMGGQKKGSKKAAKAPAKAPPKKRYVKERLRCSQR